MYRGACHCGGVHFVVESTISELTTCDCSLCAMRRALMAKVPAQALRVTHGQERLTLYQWNTRRARHYFCSRCGIYVFHRKRSAPDHCGVNACCLENFDASTMPVHAAAGARMTIEDPAARRAWPGPRTGR